MLLFRVLSYKVIYGVEWLRQLFNDIRRFSKKIGQFIQLITEPKPSDQMLLYLFDIN